MKKLSLLLILFISSLSFLAAQAPAGFKYQAVARDAANIPYASANIALRVSLIRDGVSGIIDYSERHFVTTSDLGVFDLQIGNGTTLNGVFGGIDWGSHNYYIKVDMDVSGGTDYVNMGIAQLLSVPYALYAASSGSGGGADDDADPTNELQTLSFNSATNQLTLSDGNSVIIPSGGTDADADPTNEIQNISKVGSTVTLSDGGGSFTDEKDDADANPTNELQNLSFNVATNELSLSDGNSVTIPSGGTDADADPTNEIQNIAKVGSTVTLSNGGGSFTDEKDDADANPTNELQNLSFNAATNELSLSDGNSVTIPSGGTDADADPTNEIQTVSKAGNTVTLSDGGGNFTVDDADADAGNELQNLSFNAATNELSLSDGNSVTIPSGGTDADADPTNEIQNISKAGNIVTLSDGGGTFTDAVDDADADATNEFQNLSFNAATNELSLSDGNSVTIPTGGTDADADPTNEFQNLSFNAATNELSLSDGNSVTIPTGGTDADADPTNEIQTISKAGNTVTLSNGGGNFTDAVDDADADTSNELQTISKAGNTVTLSDGGGTFTDAVDDADADATNEFQNLSFNAATSELSLSDGNSVTIPTGGTDADADPTNEIQTISKAGNTVTLSNGGGNFTDAVDDADANASNELQTISKAGNTVTLSDGGGTFTDAINDADADATNEIQALSISGNQISLSNGGGIINIPDNQQLTLSGTNLSIEDGNTVSLIALQDGVNDADADPTNEIQTISKSGTTVTLSNGGGNFTDAVDDADANASNELQTLALTDNDLTLSNGGGTIDLSGVGSVSPWGADGDGISYTESIAVGTSPLAKIEVRQTSDIWEAAYFQIANQESTATAFVATTNGGGRAATFTISNDENTRPVIVASTEGLGEAADFSIENKENTDSALRTYTNGTGSAVYGRSVGGIGGYFVTDSTHQLALRTSTKGRVAFGTDEANAKVTILHNSNDNDPGLFIKEDEDDYASIAFSNTETGYISWLMKGYPADLTNESKFLIGENYLGFGFSPKLSILANGNIGIGQINPDQDLVVGVNHGSGWLFPTITVGNPTGGAIQVGNLTEKISISASSSPTRSRIVATNASGVGEGIIEMSTSQLSIGDFNVVGGAYITRFKQTGVYGLQLVKSSDESKNWEFSVWKTSNNLDLYFGGNGRGNFDAISGNYSATSDARLKTNINSLENTLPSLLLLKPKKYNYKTNTSREYFGFLAQDLQKVFPNIVTESEGREGAPSTLMVDYAQLSVLAITALQEQNKKIEDLEKRLERLEALLDK